MKKDSLLASPTPPLCGGCFFFLLGVVGVSIHFLKLPFFFLSPQVTQEILVLLFLNLLAINRFFSEPRLPLRLEGFHLFVLAGVGFVILTNLGDLLGVSVLLAYVFLLLLLEPLSSTQFIPALLSFASLSGVLLSVYEFQCMKLGLTDLLGPVSWLTGYKSKIIFSGIYGQANLFATLCLVGIWCTVYLLESQTKKNPLRVIPLSLLFCGLFLTTSRGGLLALITTGLAMVWYMGKRHSLRQNLPLLGGLALAVLAGYFMATHLGTTSMEKAVAYSGVSEAADISNFRRLNYGFSALRMGLDHFWTGAGVGSFKMLLSSYMRGTAETLRIGYGSISPTLWAHNDFLQIFAETGIFPLLCLIAAIATLFRAVFRCSDGKSFFLFLALLGFIIMMGLSYPFRYHALLFSAVGLTNCLAYRGKTFFLIKPKAYLPVLLLVMLLIDGVMAGHFLKAHQFNRFFDFCVAKGGDLTVDEFRRAEQKLLVDGYDDSLLGWRFQGRTYEELINPIFEKQDAAFASYLLPQVEKFNRKGVFPSLHFVLAKLHYVLGNYPAAKVNAEKAFEAQPDSEVYGGFVHFFNVMAISQREKIPVIDLLYKPDYQLLLEKGILGSRQLDERGVPR